MTDKTVDVAAADFAADLAALRADLASLSESMGGADARPSRCGRRRREARGRRCSRSALASGESRAGQRVRRRRGSRTSDRERSSDGSGDCGGYWNGDPHEVQIARKVCMRLLSVLAAGSQQLARRVLVRTALAFACALSGTIGPGVRDLCAL
jgi:hypothetical protein